MTKTYTFASKNNNNKTFFLNNKLTFEPDYSKIIDDIITADIANKNDYLFTSLNTHKIYTPKPIILSGSTLKGDDEFASAIKFLTNYKSYKKIYNLPYIIGKMYTLSDGTPIIFYDDEIQIGFDTYKYSDFNNLSFLSGITKKTKKIIINIYTNGAANIDINIL